MAGEQAQLQKEGGACKREVEATREALADLCARKEAYTARKTRFEELSRTRDSLASAPMDLERAQIQAAAIQKQLESEEFAPVKRVQKGRIEQELGRLKNVKSEYETAAARARTLVDADLRHDRLLDAEKQQAGEQEEVERREALAASKQEALEAHREATAVLNEELTELGSVRAQAERAEAELNRLSNELAGGRRREGALLGYLEDCDRAARQVKEKEGECKRIRQEQWTYDRLAGCFGKKGIQALIIENAIPEIEQEANDLLSKMTDNGMQVRFLTTRAGKTTKSEIETLDISITDDEGPRPYELFSGGEAFRVNFAIRIALSRLLARRSGARLQTLILDEGFGTQDGKGREKLVEAIESIKGDFEKIIVITHVEELKDAFPQRIEVSKDGKGSKIYVY
jgi:exonuclease SbcC